MKRIFMKIAFATFAITAGSGLSAIAQTVSYAIQDLGALRGGPRSPGALVNARGQKIATENGRALRWTPGVGLADLGTLGGSVSFAYGINNAGQVVGASETADGSQHAFLYSDRAGMEDLNGLLDSSLGWELMEARSINGAGMILGWGVLRGQNRLFLMTPLIGMMSEDHLTFKPKVVFGGDMSRATFKWKGMAVGDTLHVTTSVGGKAENPKSPVTDSGGKGRDIGATAKEEFTFDVQTFKVTKKTEVSFKVDLMRGKDKIAEGHGRLTVLPNALASLTIDKPKVIIGSPNSTATVKLKAAVTDPKGQTVKIGSSKQDVGQPVDDKGKPIMEVTVKQGSDTATFEIKPTGVGKTVIEAEWKADDHQEKSEREKTAEFEVEKKPAAGKPALKKFRLAPGRVQGGNRVKAKLTLTAPAPVGGYRVRLSGGMDERAGRVVKGLPMEVIIPEGKSKRDVMLETNVIGRDAVTWLTALDEAKSTLEAPLAVTPLVVVRVDFPGLTAPVKVGRVVDATVTLNAIAETDTTIEVTSDRDFAEVVGPVVVKAGTNVATFKVKTVETGKDPLPGNAILWATTIPGIRQAHGTLPVIP